MLLLRTFGFYLFFSISDFINIGILYIVRGAQTHHRRSPYAFTSALVISPIILGYTLQIKLAEMLTLNCTVEMNFSYRTKHSIHSTRICKIVRDNVEIIACISSYTRLKRWCVISHPCPRFQDGLVKPPLILGHVWIITYCMKQRM